MEFRVLALSNLGYFTDEILVLGDICIYSFNALSGFSIISIPPLCPIEHRHLAQKNKEI